MSFARLIPVPSNSSFLGSMADGGSASSVGGVGGLLSATAATEASGAQASEGSIHSDMTSRFREHSECSGGTTKFE